MMKSITSRLLLLFLLPPLLLLQPSSGQEDSHLIRRRLHGAGVHREFYCSLQNTPITQVAINETIGKVYEVKETDTTNTPPQQTTYAAKACACYGGFLNSTSYCPADSTYCSISVAYNYQYSYIASRIEGHDPSVTCFRDTQLKGFARYVWKYCTIILAALIVVLVFTDTGRNVTRHALSRCIPQINTRQVEQRLTAEIESQRQHFFRWRERVGEEGHIFGLKLKTKIYHPKAREDMGDLEQVDNDEGEQSCSICILELEGGERIADLDCNHYFHADCLSEWIKKKNSCPLCQAEGIAEEIRSYDIETSESHVDAINVRAMEI